jgi:hypothetical protein
MNVLALALKAVISAYVKCSKYIACAKSLGWGILVLCYKLSGVEDNLLSCCVTILCCSGMVHQFTGSTYCTGITMFFNKKDLSNSGR